MHRPRTVTPLIVIGNPVLGGKHTATASLGDRDNAGNLKFKVDSAKSMRDPEQVADAMQAQYWARS